MLDKLFEPSSRPFISSCGRRIFVTKTGKCADIALFDVMKLEYAGSLSDPAAALLFCGYDHGAEHVIIDGKLAVENRRLTGADEEEIRMTADKASKRLLEKAGVTG